MEKTLWESPAKNADGKPFFTVKMAQDYYIFGERLGKDSIAFILYDEVTGLYGVINECKPPLGYDVFLTTAFGGSIDKDVSLVNIVIDEVQEEAGYTVGTQDIQFVGRVLVSTQMNQMCYLYLVDVTDKQLGERDPDEHEASSVVVWLPKNAVIGIEDWKAATIISKYENIYNP